jgi:glycosyltransferase involved in cell wall biosynthesis
MPAPRRNRAPKAKPGLAPEDVSLSFVVCVNDDAILNANLLTSPCLSRDSRHELIIVRDAANAADGLNRGLEEAKHPLVVCLHQDVVLPQGWDRRLVEQYRLAEERLGRLGVAGVYGVGAPRELEGGGLEAERIGHVVDRGRLLSERSALPAPASTLDELLLVLPRGTPLRFDPALGFHLYGADICLQAAEQGAGVAVLEALCSHNSRGVGLPEAFFASAAVFARKWAARLPVATPCVVFDRAGSVFLLDNTPPDGSAAPAVAGVRLAPPGPGGRVLASVIIPCWNQLEYTQLCLQSLFERTGPGWELIVVDNGSTDGTGEYLAGIGGRCPVPVRVITNKENRGFPAAANQGLQAARGDYLVLLNNDTVVTDGWLDGLGALTGKTVEGGRPVGLVGPMSNYVTPPQVVEPVPYQEMEAMHAFARAWKERHRGGWQRANKLSGFCLLMTRAAYEAVGGLDERFGLGFFEDDDLALRVRKAGFELAVARDVFVHHFGNRTMTGNRVDAERLMNENLARLRAKWGAEAPAVIRGRRGGGPLVIDAVLFYQEFDMLEFRLKVLYPHVDYFVVVEADKTFSGKEKPFHYEGQKERFAWAADKIVYFKMRCDTSRLDLTSAPTAYQPDHDCWQIEYAQRGAIVAACEDFAEDDILIMGDVDEIPAPEAVAWARQNVGLLPAACQQHFFFYDLRHLKHEVLLNSVFATMGTARALGTQELRNRRGVMTGLANAGWHLSYFGDADAIVRKIEAFSHQEFNVPEFKDKEHIRHCLASGEDLYKKTPKARQVGPEFFPPYFKEHAPAHWWGAGGGANEEPNETSKESLSMIAAANKNPAQKAKVSLTMIVRNEEKNLPRCLESVRGLFDEMVVVDTGSTDRTKDIAAGFGARVVDFAWVDDFAAARNVALEHATGDYAMWLDADDVVEPPERKKLKALLVTLRAGKKEAYVLRCFCATDAGAQIAVDHPRLFPLLPGIRWERRIHEVINPALERAGVQMTWTDIVIRHLGYVDAPTHERKRQRNLVLLQKELAERPDDPFIYYYLGTLAFEREKWQEALGYFILSLAKWGTTQSIACKLFAMIAWTNQILQRYDESLRVATEGLHFFPEDGELLFRKGIALRYLRRPDEAEACFMRILSLGRPKTFYNVEPGIYGHMTRGNLALIAQERGDYALARVHWQAALAECPGYPEALRRLAEMDGTLQAAGVLA